MVISNFVFFFLIHSDLKPDEKQQQHRDKCNESMIYMHANEIYSSEFTIIIPNSKSVSVGQLIQCPVLLVAIHSFIFIHSKHTKKTKQGGWKEVRKNK